MSLRHVWGWYPPQTTSYTPIWHTTQSIWAINMLSQGHMGAPWCSCHNSSQVGPRFVELTSLVEWEWFYILMVETNIYLRILHTLILNIYKVLEPLLCCLKGICVHPYTNPLTKLSPELGILDHLWSENDAITSCLRLISTSHHFINPYETYPKCLSHWYAVSRAYGCTLMPLYWPNWPQIWEFWVTFEKGLMS